MRARPTAQLLATHAACAAIALVGMAASSRRSRQATGRATGAWWRVAMRARACRSPGVRLRSGACRSASARDDDDNGDEQKRFVATDRMQQVDSCCAQLELFAFSMCACCVAASLRSVSVDAVIVLRRDVVRSRLARSSMQLKPVTRQLVGAAAAACEAKQKPGACARTPAFVAQASAGAANCPGGLPSVLQAAQCDQAH